MIDDPLSVIWPLLGRHVAYQRRLVDLTGGVKAALLLSQAIYWTRHGVDIERSGGWFHKTAEQWALETGLTWREQSSARDVLRDGGLLQGRRLGMPAMLNFRVDLEELARRLRCLAPELAGAKPWSESASRAPEPVDPCELAELLGPSVAFHRALASLGGSVHAGLMLSQTLYQTRLQLRRQAGPWVVCSAQKLWQELGLTRREHEVARRLLTEAGLWQERLRGWPPVLSVKVRLESLLHRLSEAPFGVRVAGSPPQDADCEEPTFQIAPNVETRLRDPHIHVSRKPPSQIRQNRHHRFNETAIPVKVLSTSVSVQIPPPPHRAREALACGQLFSGSVQARGGGELRFPEQLLPQEREAAWHMLQATDFDRQVLLDELAGRLMAAASGDHPGTGSAIHSPLGYLRGLIQRAAEGRFVPELALRVSAMRTSAPPAGTSRSQGLQAQQEGPTQCVTADPKAGQEDQKARARVLLADLKQKLAQRRA